MSYRSKGFGSASGPGEQLVAHTGRVVAGDRLQGGGDPFPPGGPCVAVRADTRTEASAHRDPRQPWPDPSAGAVLIEG